MHQAPVVTRPPPRIGIALGAGVARGWAHIGVLRALAERGIVPDIVAGCSIGALVGGVHLADRLDALEEWACRLSKLRILGYLDLRMRGGGMIGGHRLISELRQHVGELRIETLASPFAAVTTDLATGHEVWLRDGDLVDALKASIALPGIFPPVRVDHRWLVDGALVNPVPVSVCRALGAEIVIAVNLNTDIIGKVRRPPQPHDADRPIPEPPPPEPIEVASGFRLDSLARRVFQNGYDGPNLFGVMVSSLAIIQDRISRSRLAGEPPDVHVAPRIGHIGLLEFDRAAEAIAEGAAALVRALPELDDAIEVFAQQYIR